MQIGAAKCLAIVGVRLRDLPKPGECLRHRDLHLIALVPQESWTRADVDRALEEATQRTGVPRVIVTDHGSDLHGGVRLFQERHAQTAEICDVKHKAACLLKHRLEKEPRWREFQAGVGETRCAVQQTELAFLTPPAPKPKARFMNLEPQLAWAEGVLKVLRDPPAQVLQWATPERLEAKLGWLRDFAAPVAEWSEWQQVVNVAVEFVNRQGVQRCAAPGVAADVRAFQQRGPGDGPRRVRRRASAASPSGGTLAGKHGGAGIVLRQAEGAGEAAIPRRLHEPAAAVRRHRHRGCNQGGACGQATQRHRSGSRVVQATPGDHAVRLTENRLCKWRNRNRMKARGRFHQPRAGVG